MVLHGSVSAQWHQDLFEVYAYGPFNEAGVLHCAEELQKAVIDNPKESWVRYEEWDDEVSGSQETIDNAAQLWLWYDSMGCKASAILVHSGFQGLIVDKLMTGNTKMFFDKQEALTWLEQQRAL
ncbi:hypothetical protein [Vibrio sp. SCSIO 43136]|uniref:hypothetical protein n=1 Tax=Vibrio sp. SCSIO 43136 TaxID=2819101 RepID=UPI002075D7EF|nr:hypothetical protein [Vibrio sp. SCSIO 43136]USD64442.1 hypothetical protein J4N39_10035 [Vibrio sp. SCSIO 43136]